MARYQVDIYYDVVSPYSWIAFEGLLRYEKVWPISVNLKPFILRDIMVAAGNKPPATVPNKGMYMLNDLERNNAFWGMHLQPPARFMQWIRNPETTTAFAMKILTAIKLERPEYLVPASREYWQRLWTQGEPIFSQQDHELVLRAAGLPNPDHFISKLSDLDVEKVVRQTTEAAAEQGAFGAPWIVVHKDGQEHCFFGSDRFHLIGHLLGEIFTDGKKELAAKFFSQYNPRGMFNRGKYLVELYYDVMSPFSWIGFEGLLRYEKVWPIEVRLKPFWLREIFLQTGNKSPVANPNKGLHMIRELQLLNDFWGMRLQYPKDFKKWIGSPDSSSERAMKILIALQCEEPDRLETVSRHYWNRLWTEGKPIFSREDHQAVLTSAGLSTPNYWLTRIEEEPIGQKLHENAVSALSLGCFGAPWIVVHKDGQTHSFFGSDRFHLIGHLLGETFTDGKKNLAARL